MKWKFMPSREEELAILAAEMHEAHENVVAGLVQKMSDQARAHAVQLEERDKRASAREAVLARTAANVREAEYKAEEMRAVLAAAKTAHEEEVARTEAALARAMAAEAEHARLAACHATRVRVGHIPIDPIDMTARARAVEGSVRAEWDGDKIVLYAGRMLTEAEHNAVVAAILPQLNRT